jgi:hypothetical protein
MFRMIPAIQIFVVLSAIVLAIGFAGALIDYAHERATHDPANGKVNLALWNRFKKALADGLGSILFLF